MSGAQPGGMTYVEIPREVYPAPAVDYNWQKRQFRQIALDAALKLSTTAEPEKRLIERARVIFDFLYGEEK